MARTTNYDGRRVSLSIYPKSFDYRSNADQSAATTLNGSTGGWICAGIAKLCQSVLVFILSDEIVFDSTWGSALPRYMNSSVQYMAMNVESILESAFAETVRQLRKNERSDAPDDECISDITLDNWDYDEDGGGITINITVTSVAGESRDVLIPLNMTV